MNADRLSMEIIVDNVTFTYSAQVVALKEVSLIIQPGESVAIIGENGAGKSTLAKHFNGLLLPSVGQVKVGGWDTREHSPAELAARVGFAFQNPDDQLFKRTVHSEVAFGPQNLGFSVEESIGQRPDPVKEGLGVQAEGPDRGNQHGIVPLPHPGIGAC